MKKGTKRGAPGLIRRIRKPMAPPTRVEQDKKRYQRSRERQNIQRALDEPNAHS
jgi:hypothetical protein